MTTLALEVRGTARASAPLKLTLQRDDNRCPYARLIHVWRTALRAKCLEGSRSVR